MGICRLKVHTGNQLLLSHGDRRKLNSLVHEIDRAGIVCMFNINRRVVVIEGFNECSEVTVIVRPYANNVVQVAEIEGGLQGAFSQGFLLPLTL